MSEIPADIMAAAERTHAMIMANPSTESTAILRIARAIQAERDRCLEGAGKVRLRSDEFNGAHDGVGDVINMIKTGDSFA